MIETVVGIAGIVLIVLGCLAFTAWLWKRDETAAIVVFLFDVTITYIAVVAIVVLAGS